MALSNKSIELPNGVRIDYAEQGNTSGIPLMLIHGYMDSWRSFELVLPHLPESIHAFALTQRGHGDSSRPPSGYSSQDFVSDLFAFMASMRIESAVIAGGSSGGFVARHFAIDYPKLTLGLVLVGSPFLLRDKPGVLEMWDSTISTLTDPINPGFVREFAESTLSPRVPKEFIETVAQENLKVPAYIWKETFMGLLEDDSVDKLNKIEAPTLIIWGNQDTIVSRGDQELLTTKIPDSKLVVYSGAGHGLYCEEPGRFATDLITFIEGIVH